MAPPHPGRRRRARLGRLRSCATSAPSGRSEELREGFVATVSHELRTPLSLIRGYAETLLHLDLTPEQQRDYLERIDEVTGRLSALVGQILDVTHLQADPLILERAPVAVRLARRPAARATSRSPGGADRLVDRAAGRPAAARRRRAASRPDPREPRRQRLQVRPGRRAGRRSVRRPTGEWLTVDVDDEGVGIPDTERPLVTEPFHRAWNVRESRIPGTGLGLYICRRLVEAHGGRLRLDDRPDGPPGTRVTFTLPLLRGRRRSRRGRRQAACEAETVAEPILIVEDEPEFADLRRALDGPGRLPDRRRPDRAPTPCAASTTTIRTS